MSQNELSQVNGNLTASQENALSVTERVNSSLSVLAVVFIFLTYLLSPHFNKPINRLIFFASWSNLGVNIAGLISVNGPLAGDASALCQFQGFLVQMFLGVDAYWAFCMAINVYLAMFRGWTVERLRNLDYRYLIACYGLAFIPAAVFLGMSHIEENRIYGNAIIWCWATSRWSWVRIALLYAIVWLAILFAAVIYVLALRKIWKKRDMLDGYMNPFNEDPFKPVVSTSIEITTETIRPESRRTSGVASWDDPYTVSVDVQKPLRRELPDALRVGSIARQVAMTQENAEAWLYARVAFLFFVALLIVWVPSSVNRVYALANKDTINFGLNYVSSFVFPLQGLLNLFVYVVASQTACRRLLSDLRWRREKGQHLTGGSRASPHRQPGPVEGTQGTFRNGGKKFQRFQSLSSLEDQRR